MMRLKAAKFAALAVRPGLWPAAAKGVAASVEHASVPFDPATRTVIDVGASRGQFALFARQAFPAARVICFEPLPGPGDKLREVLGGDVELISAAVGERPGTAVINVSGRDDSSSLLPIGPRQETEFPGTAMTGTAEVTVTTLDQALADRELVRPCLLKVDVQGFELAALRGGTTTLASVDQVLVECSFVELYEGQPLADEVVSFLVQRGFRLRGIHAPTYSSDHSAVQADFFFVRGESKTA
jgi:FkbM family methyltransferase